MPAVQTAGILCTMHTAVFVDTVPEVCYHLKKENSILPFKISPVRLIKGAYI